VDFLAVVFLVPVDFLAALFFAGDDVDGDAADATFLAAEAVVPTTFLTALVAGDAAADVFLAGDFFAVVFFAAGTWDSRSYEPTPRRASSGVDGRCGRHAYDLGNIES
jgi:hypothetical protein